MALTGIAIGIVGRIAPPCGIPGEGAAGHRAAAVPHALGRAVLVLHLAVPVPAQASMGRLSRRHFPHLASGPQRVPSAKLIV